MTIHFHGVQELELVVGCVTAVMDVDNGPLLEVAAGEVQGVPHCRGHRSEEPKGAMAGRCLDGQRANEVAEIRV